MTVFYAIPIPENGGMTVGKTYHCTILFKSCQVPKSISTETCEALITFDSFMQTVRQFYLSPISHAALRAITCKLTLARSKPA
jgi:hypothetical protein